APSAPDAPEVCDGKDNNCDGLVDTADGRLVLVSCGVDLGVCAQAMRPLTHCVADGDTAAWLAEPCSAEELAEAVDGYEAQETTCDDGLDNDCDGEIDADDQDCSAGCETTAENDVTCDGNDDDCNGVVDDGWEAVATACFLHGCSGIQTPSCTGNAEVEGDCVLTEEQRSVNETCNSTDDDCDGETDADDEDLVLAPCDALGVCAQALHAREQCVGGAWEACGPTQFEAHADYEAEETRCDDKDNDCDGQTDTDVAKKTCGVGECQVTLDGCTDGAPTVCPDDVNEGGSTEACDNLDNDCDGETDEGVVATEVECGVGSCLTMVSTSCVNGVEVPDCVDDNSALQTPDTTCDNLDNDCDGEIDEDFVEKETTCGQGVCTATGVTTCSPGGFDGDSCVAGTPAPEGETCNGLDDDCDGVEDNGLPDVDGDGQCDDIDGDIDGDGVPNEDDSCPLLPNPVQTWGLDDPAACCGCPDGPTGAVATHACVDGKCEDASCTSTHYDNPDTPDVVDCVERPEQLWVDGIEGLDTNSGQTPGTELRTIVRALELAQPWTLIHIKGLGEETVYDEFLDIETRGVRLQGYDDVGDKSAVIASTGSWSTIRVGARDVSLGEKLVVHTDQIGVSVNAPTDEACANDPATSPVTAEIFADNGWQTTLVSLSAWESVHLTATGEWSNGLDGSLWGPAGNVDVLAADGFLCPGLPEFALVARVGGSNHCQLVGAGATVVNWWSLGNVQLAINDSGVSNNTGTMTVNMAVCRSENVVIEDIVIRGTPWDPDVDPELSVRGLYSGGSRNLTLRGTTVEDLTASGGDDDGASSSAIGVELGNCVDVAVQDLSISNLLSGANGETRGLHVYECVNVTLDTVAIDSLQTGEHGGSVGISSIGTQGVVQISRATITDI
ncbi:MAG: MopE-related protein, partial [Myxococcota bacterium]|nr:MopE-related protein [Myxococcota bacterium]